MKKTLLTILCAAFGLCAMAQNVKTYTEPYVVAVNEVPTESKTADIVIEDNGDATINFVFKDLQVTMYGKDVDLGEIRLENIDAFEISGNRYFEVEKGTYSFDPASLPPTLKPMAGAFQNIPYDLSGYIVDERLWAVLQIHMTQLGQEIVVAIGEFDNSIVYTEDLFVTINGETSGPQPTDVTVVFNQDNTINFVLKNFFLGAGEEAMPVGNIVIENIPVTMGTDGLAYISYQGNIFIQPGDMEGVDEWYGPMISYAILDENGNPAGIPIVLNGKLSEDKLFVILDIDMQSTLQQVVHVQLGTDNFSTNEGKVYTEDLVVTINGETSEPQPTDVTVVDNGDGTINFVLENFMLGSGDFVIPVGNIVVENVTATAGEDGLTYIAYEGNIFIQPGDKEGVDAWYGPMISNAILDENGNPAGIPIVLNGKLNDEKLFVILDIDMQSTLQQVVHVQLGTDDFDQPDVTRFYNEPYFVTAVGATPTSQNVDVVVYDRGNEIDFELQDFVLELENMKIPFGNLILHNLEAWQEEDGKTHFKGQRTVSVPDDLIPEEYQQFAIFMKNLPVTVTGKFDEKWLYAEFDTSVPMVNISVHVQIGLADGDVNGDGSIDIADVVSVLNAMAGGNALGNPDTNGDGETDIADVVKVLSLMAGQQ